MMSLLVVARKHSGRMCTGRFCASGEGSASPPHPVVDRQTPVKQECIPVGCVPSATVAVYLRVSPREGGVCSGVYTPLDRILDTCLWKHYLSGTSFADGKYYLRATLLAGGKNGNRKERDFFLIKQTPYTEHHGWVTCIFRQTIGTRKMNQSS